ncbi:hypothetical protein [Leuconostoc mesenteroides]|uniref:hypothetical protein n=1 Tax=Leuconostoc mesenteroides TaxID=1245 RepID=UPI0021A3D119|nr:hypothetical protein [Leuconostoc mesenteroides]MCT3048617.1 hypothetical protein [Leuconostoc mesenteroides]
MTEPVAYRVDGTIYNNINDAEFAVREIEHLRSSLGIDNGLIKKPIYIQPLYTDEQLHPRVKMTRAEFDELEISLINAQFDYSELKKTIEIVPDMKWFVRSLVADEGYYSYLFKHSNRPIADYEPSKQPRKEYMIFDTKEEAEKWTNPLTEAVQLPVEGE